jgi:hypothetical protein
MVIAHECPSATRAHVLEVPAGRDVLSCVGQFVRRHRRGALVLGASGRVTDVVLRRDPPRALTGGRMKILSMSGCFFPSSYSAGTAVFLAGPRGSVLSGGGACHGWRLLGLQQQSGDWQLRCVALDLEARVLKARIFAGLEGNFVSPPSFGA